MIKMNEEYLFESSFLRILDGDVTPEDVNEFLTNTDVGSIETEYEQMAPIDFVLTHGNPDIVLSKREKVFVGYIYSCFSVENENSQRVFVIELNLNNPEPFFESAALIKIFNLLFADKDNLYLFISNGSISLGNKRYNSTNEKNNFCISNFFNNSLIEEAYNFFNSGCETSEEFTDNIMFNSKIEHSYSNYDDNCYRSQYDETLAYLIDSIVRNNDGDMYDMKDSENIIFEDSESLFEEKLQYMYISKELNDIGEYRESKSAFELLQESQQLSNKEVEYFSHYQSDDVDENFTDADTLLNEILNKK